MLLSNMKMSLILLINALCMLVMDVPFNFLFLFPSSICIQDFVKYKRQFQPWALLMRCKWGACECVVTSKPLMIDNRTSYNFLETLENPKMWWYLNKGRSDYMYHMKWILQKKELSQACHFKCMHTSTSSCWTNQLLKWLANLRVKLGFHTTLTTIMSNSLVTQIQQSGKHLCVL